MAQQVNVLAAMPEDLSSIPRTHVVERENQFPQADLQPPYEYCGTCVHHSHKQINKKQI